MYHSCAWFDVRVTLWECEVTGAGLLVGSTEGGKGVSLFHLSSSL